METLGGQRGISPPTDCWASLHPLSHSKPQRHRWRSPACHNRGPGCTCELLCYLTDSFWGPGNFLAQENWLGQVIRNLSTRINKIKQKMAFPICGIKNCSRAWPNKCTGGFRPIFLGHTFPLSLPPPKFSCRPFGPPVMRPYSCDETLIRCMVLTYLTSLPSCLTAFK